MQTFTRSLVVDVIMYLSSVVFTGMLVGWGYSLMFLLPLFFTLRFCWWDLLRKCARAKSLARRVANHKWCLHRAHLFEKGTVCQLDSRGWWEIKYYYGPRTDDAAELEFYSIQPNDHLLFTFTTLPGRPGAGVLKSRLACFNIVEFELIKPPWSMLGTEPYTYLALKT